MAFFRYGSANSTWLLKVLRVTNRASEVHPRSTATPCSQFDFASAGHIGLDCNDARSTCNNYELVEVRSVTADA